MAEKMYRTAGSLQPVQASNQDNKPSPSFEEQMSKIVNEHLVKLKPFESLCSDEPQAEEQTETNDSKSVYAVLQKGVMQPSKANRITIAQPQQDENDDEPDEAAQESDSNDKQVDKQVNLHDIMISNKSNNTEETDDIDKTYAEIDESKIDSTSLTNITEATAGSQKRRHYKILRYDDTGKKSVVKIHVTAEDGELDDEEAQIIALDAMEQENLPKKNIKEEELVAIAALEDSLKEDTKEKATLKKKPSALLRMKQTFSPKKIKNTTKQAETPQEASSSPAKTPKSPRQFFQSIFTWNKEHMKSVSLRALKTWVGQSWFDMYFDLKRVEKPSTGEFISARKHTAYYEEDDVYTWAYGGYEKRIEIRERRDKSSVPYITVQSQADGGKIFTSDRIGKCIRIYTAEGTYIQTTTCLSAPLGIDIYDSNKVVCAYPGDHSVAMLDLTKMVQLQTIKSKNLKMPRGIARNPLHSGAIAVSDVQNLDECSIKLFDLKSGKLVHTICSNSAINFGWTEFITYGRNDKNYLYVSDSWKHKVYGFDLRSPDNPVLEFGEQGSSHGCISNPCGIAFLPEDILYPNGSILLSDWFSDRVPAFDPEMGDLQQYVLVERFGSPTPISSPYDLVADEKGTIFASESSSNYIKVFTRQEGQLPNDDYALEPSANE